MIDGNNADAENRGRYQACRKSHLALATIILDLIDAGVLVVK